MQFQTVFDLADAAITLLPLIAMTGFVTYLGLHIHIARRA
jgi:hypothetical protein